MLVRIFNMIATSGFLAALECTKFVFSRGTTLGELTVLPQTPRWFKGNLRFKGGVERRKSNELMTVGLPACRKKEMQNFASSKSAFVFLHAGRPTSISLIRSSHHVVICTFGHVS